MPERKKESGEQRQDRIQHEQHRPEQNRGYDEAVRGGRAVANERPQVEDALPMPPDDESPSGESVDDRETQAAIEDVQRHEHSADRSVRPLKR